MAQESQKVKYNTIHERAILESEKAKPSSDPAWWAKKNCKHCYGRGVVGKIRIKFGDNNTMMNEQLCACAKKNFVKWREEWCAEYVAKHEKSILETPSNVDNAQ